MLALSLLATALAAAWVARDAAARRLPAAARAAWAAAVLALGPLALGPYLAVRPLRLGEARRGGRAWQTAVWFAIAWTAYVAWMVGGGAFVAAPAPGQARPPLAATLGVWGVVTALALLAGVALRKERAVEEGPSGPLAAEAMRRWRGGPPSAERRYDCAECGGPVPAGVAFCRRCGAPPGTSG